MAETDRIPAQVFCLAEFLAEEMEARGWRATDVGVRMGTDDSTVDELGQNVLIVDLLLAVQDDKLIISKDLYRQLERAFGVSDGFFERLDAPWHKYPDRRAPFEAPEYLYSR